MNRLLLLSLASLTTLTISHAQVTVAAANTQSGGWLAGGWGTYEFTFQNASDVPAKIVFWEARWIVGGQPTGQPWSAAIDVDVTQARATVKKERGYLPPEIMAGTRPKPALMRGTFRVQQGGRTYDVPWELEIPEARLTGKYRTVTGRHTGLELLEDRFRAWRGQGRALRWLDEAYRGMEELTGYRPWNGKRMILKEVPDNGVFAYSGDPIQLNTTAVPDSLKQIEQGIIPFGWIHEIGHNFDVHGSWYIWNSPTAEMQANFKLAYVLETMPSRDWEVAWGHFRNPNYPFPGPDARKKVGRDFVDALFTTNGDSYLADPTREWTSLSSDELQGFFQRIQRVYGWEPIKQWYRTYARLEATGLKPPATAEGKIRLAAAILNRTTGVDLVPVFRRWRMPVTAESVARTARTYRLS